MKTNNLIACLGLLLVTIVGCSEHPDFTVTKPLVETYVIPIRSSANIYKFPAVVSASDLTYLSFRINGELVEVAAYNGKKVKKGDLIAKIDPTTYKLTVKDRKAKVEFAKLTMDRTEKLVALGSMAQSVYDELEAKYRVAKALHEHALLQLSYVELRAPFDGVIASVPADNFQNTSTGQLVAVMHRIDKIEIKVDLPDVILAATEQRDGKREKLKFYITLDAYPDHTFIASYKEHTTEQTDENKKYLLILEMPVDADRIALQGMPGNIEINTDKLKTKNVVINSVPVEAVLLPDKLTTVTKELIVWRVISDSTVESIKVTPGGFSSSSFIDVIGPLNEGDEIVVAGMMYLQDGLAVDVLQQEGKAK
ncbi:hypothetical protein A9Q98_13425 [Thalassotalea sp. 42_200_T64]|nr:hypothetical protein A9Q98_13425 [Thalassotalea sp. 42_200_T64]